MLEKLKRNNKGGILMWIFSFVGIAFVIFVWLTFKVLITETLPNAFGLTAANPYTNFSMFGYDVGVLPIIYDTTCFMFIGIFLLLGLVESSNPESGYEGEYM